MGFPKLAYNRGGLVDEALRQRGKHRNARCREAGCSGLLASVVTRGQVPGHRVDLPGQRGVVPPRIGDAEETAAFVVNGGVPPRLGQTAAAPHRLRRPFGGRPDAGADIAEHRSRDRGAPPLGGLDFGPELTNRAEAALHGVGEQFGHLFRRSDAACPVDEGARNRCQRHPAARYGVRHPVRALNDDVPGACRLLFVGDEEVDPAVGIRPAPNPVSSRGLDAGHHRVRPRVEEARNHQLVRGWLTGAEKDGRGQQQLPRTTGTTTSVHGSLRHSERHERRRADHPVVCCRLQLRQLRPVGPWTSSHGGMVPVAAGAPGPFGRRGARWGRGPVPRVSAG